jgi:hypothetical protein
VTARQIYIKKDTCKVSHLCLAAAEQRSIRNTWIKQQEEWILQAETGSSFLGHIL